MGGGRPVTAAGWNSSTRFPDGSTGEDLRAAGTGHDLVAERHALRGEAGDLAVEVVDDEVDAVPTSRARSLAVGHRPAGRALRARTAGAAGCRACTSANAGTRDADGEAEVAGVEVDARGDVVDQVADVHDVGRQPWWVLSSGRVREVGEQQRDAALDLVGDVLERGVASPRRVSPAAAGSAMLQCAAIGAPGNSGQTSRTLSHSVMTRSKRLRAKRVSGFVGRPAMSMPRSAMTRTAFGCSGLGWLPALRASTVPADRCSTSASAIWERALLPVHRNSSRGRARRGATSAGGVGREREPGMERRARRRRAGPGSGTGRPGSRRRGRRPSCGGR